MSIKKIIEHHWQNPKYYLSVVLWPFSMVFSALVSLRLFLYKTKFLSIKKLEVPIIVIGNIQVGGTGKTPIIINITNHLTAKAIKVGVISRGYGRRSKETLIINPNCDDINKYGDEPLLIRNQTNVPVAVGNDKFKTAKILLAQHKDIQVILSDDGLQHYKLFRNYEIVVFPSKEINKKMFLLPQGKLREPLQRLQQVNSIIFTTIYDKIHSNNIDLNIFLKKLHLHKNISLHTGSFIYDNLYLLNNINQKADIEYFNNKKNIAICAIGNSSNFFNILIKLGIQLEKTLSFIDHYIFNKHDIPTGFDNIIITEKDAVKIAKFNLNKVWVLPMKIVIKPDIIEKIIEIIK